MDVGAGEGRAQNLRWSQVDFAAGTIRLAAADSKNGEARTFPFAALPELEALLHRQRERADALERERGCIVPTVFFRADGARIGDIYPGWHRACRAAGLAGRVPHRASKKPSDHGKVRAPRG